VGKINELAAKIARQDDDKIIDALRATKKLYEVDAFLLVAGAAGGTGSGSMPIVAKTIKQRFQDKKLYALVALPFEHEEQTDARTFYNTATCLKATYSVADAVFLCDNQRYIEKDSSLVNNMGAINRLIAEPFYDFLCAGEVKKAKHVGVRLLDAGDIMETLGGWTTLGYGVEQLATIKFPFWGRQNFKKKSDEIRRGIEAMEQALSNLSIDCNAGDSASALYLLSAPAKEMNMDLVKELSQYLSEVAPSAVIRYGDFPRQESTLKITVILSQMNAVDKVKKYFDKMPGFIEEGAANREKNEVKLRELTNAAELVPSLFNDNGD
jgi:cell division GTPase FtsZ